MRSRTIFSRVAQTAFPVWGFLGLAGLAVAAGTGTMGERALQGVAAGAAEPAGMSRD